MNSLKCVVVGDGAVGKTCLLISYTTNSFPNEYIPTVFDNYVANVMVDKKVYTLSLWDSAGSDSYSRLRPLSYQHADSFLVCYSIVSRPSFANIKEWNKEIKEHCPTITCILVGTKLDLKNDEEYKKYAERTGKIVTKEEGDSLARELNYRTHIQCSAMTQENLKDVFDEVIRAYIEKSIIKSNQNCCILL